MSPMGLMRAKKHAQRITRATQDAARQFNDDARATRQLAQQLADARRDMLSAARRFDARAIDEVSARTRFQGAADFPRRKPRQKSKR